MDPVIVLAAIIGLGVIYVMLPTGLAEFFRHRLGRLLYCPLEEQNAAVRIDAAWAGISAATRGRPLLRIKRCSFWPKRAGCPQACLDPIKEEGGSR